VKESAKRHLVSGIFISSLILSSYILYRETELYVNTYYALSSLKAKVARAYFIIHSIVRVEFKEGRVDLSSSFEGVSNFTVAEE